MARLPVFFIPHGGGPCFFMDWDPANEWDRHRAFLEGLMDTAGEKPAALVVISAHWEEPQFTVQSNPSPGLLFDYYGFPPHTYELTWPAPGDPVLAARICELLDRAGLACTKDEKRGYDHGVFVPLKIAVPAGDIPTVQLSLNSSLDPGEHIAMGRALQPLRDEGVLIIGSGNTYHNLKKMMAARHNGAHGPVQGRQFDAWLSDAVCARDITERDKMLINWQNAPGAADAHPRPEHLLALHVCAGAAGQDTGIKILEDQVMGAVESGFRFG